MKDIGVEICFWCLFLDSHILPLDPFLAICPTSIQGNCFGHERVETGEGDRESCEKGKRMFLLGIYV